MKDNEFFETINTEVTDEKKEPKMNMSSELAQNIHNSYASAARKPNINGTEVEEHLQTELASVTTSNSKDKKILGAFKDKLAKCIGGRLPTFKITECVEAILHVILYIVIWINHQYKMELDVVVKARRKSVESELAKILSLADVDDPTPLMDRFGIRVINYEGIHDLCFLLTKVINVLCSPSHEDRKDFLKFAQANFNSLQLATINHVFSLPFSPMPLFRKDDSTRFDPAKYPDIELPTPEDFELVKYLAGNIKYYLNPPKENGYQSIHAILTLDNTSPELAGLQIELQFRTWAMDNHAENDINASHDVHKDRVKQYKKIFTLSEDELKDANIRFFNSYKNIHNDPDGIHFGKDFNCRRMNTISIW